MTTKLWGGRFKKKTDPRMEQFSSSLPFDRRLYRADIQAGIAHARVLTEGGYLSLRESKRIIKALEDIKAGIEAGKIKFSPKYEDIHSLILNHLVKKVGSIGKKLHAGRSRNDLVVLDTKLYLKEEAEELLKLLEELQKVLVNKGIKSGEVIIPGYTHLQRAQPVLLGHHLLAYVEMLERDKARLQDALRRMDLLPAGAAALAGTGLKLNQALLAKLLGFKSVSKNSMDAVSDRDFVVEILSALAILGMHLSRLSEELVLWSSSEFNFVQLDESYCTGSSFLPQKLNPDPVELIRGKTGRLYGNLIAVLVILKGLPLSYNRDLQEDKEPLFDSIDTVKSSLVILSGLIKTLKVNRRSIKRALEKDFSSAGDLAEYLVEKGVAFQQAHEIVGKLVRRCLEKGLSFTGLSLAELKKISPYFNADALKLTAPEHSVKSKTSIGSTSPARVKRQLNSWKNKLKI